MIHLDTILSDIDFSTFWGFWFFLFLSITLLLLLVYIQFLRQKTKNFFREKSILREIIHHKNDSLCWWAGEQKQINCSPSFAQVLGLNLNHPIELIDIANQIMNQGESQDFFDLNQEVQKLLQTGTSFRKTVKIHDKETKIQISGEIIHCKGQKIFILSIETSLPKESHVTESLLVSFKETAKERDYLRTLVDIAPIALWFRDQDNTIRYCNLAYAGALETTPDAVVAENRELIDKNQPSSPFNMSLAAKKNNVKQVRRTHLIIDGQRRFIEMAEIPIPTQGTTVGYALDLTEVENAENDLEEHISAHHEIIEHLSTPIAIFGSDTCLQFFNSAYQKLFDFEEAWLHTKPSYSDILQALRESRKLPEYPDFIAYKKQQLQLFKSLITPIQELIHQPDDHILRLMIAPHPIGGLLFMFDDVTGKLALERRYNTLIAVQKETLDHLYEGLVVFGSDNRLRLSNPAVRKIWQLDPIDLAPGRHATELIQQVSHLFVSVENMDNFQEQLISVFSHREPKTGQFILVNQIMIQYSYVPLPDGSHLLSFIDVSDRWRFEQILQQRNQELEHADRLKADFISHVSYEHWFY